jgi:hypothetical protein
MAEKQNMPYIVKFADEMGNNHYVEFKRDETASARATLLRRTLMEAGLPAEVYISTTLKGGLGPRP